MPVEWQLTLRWAEQPVFLAAMMLRAKARTLQRAFLLFLIKWPPVQRISSAAA